MQLLKQIKHIIARSVIKISKMTSQHCCPAIKTKQLISKIISFLCIFSQEVTLHLLRVVSIATSTKLV